jgi:mRNA interferase MazF
LGSKERPAVVINSLPGDEIILCQITSKAARDKFVIEIGRSESYSGRLPGDSYVRPNKIFTADQSIIKSIIIRKAGKLNKETISRIVETSVALTQQCNMLLQHSHYNYYFYSPL